MTTETWYCAMDNNNYLFSSSAATNKDQCVSRFNLFFGQNAWEHDKVLSGLRIVKIRVEVIEEEGVSDE